MVERQLPKLNVEGSTPFTRFQSGVMVRKFWKIVFVSACIGLLYGAAETLMMRLFKIDLDVWWVQFLFLWLVAIICIYIWQKSADSAK